MVSKLMAPFREFGLLLGFLYAIDRILRKCSSGMRLFCYEFLVQPVPEKALIPPNMAKQFEIREIRRGDSEIDLMPGPPAIKEWRFEQDAICLGTYCNGVLVGYIWFCFGEYHEDEVRCTFVLTPEKESVFDFDLYVFPEHRMGLGFMGIWNGANEFLRRRGIKYSFSRLTRFNIASRRAHEHLGAKSIARAVILKAWKVELMAITMFPYLHLSLPWGGRVRLTLDTGVLED